MKVLKRGLDKLKTDNGIIAVLVAIMFLFLLPAKEKTLAHKTVYHKALFSLDKMSVPIKLQAAIFKNVFIYDKTLKRQGTVKVLVVFEDQSKQDKDKLIAAFEALDISASASKTNQLRENSAGANVIYVCPDVPLDPVKEICAEKNLLSISGLHALVEQGDVSVSMKTVGNKPQIIVNLSRVKAEGHEISAKLLKLSKVIN